MNTLKGRVTDEYDLSALFSDWKYDFGIGIRSLIAGSIVRLDIGFSEEGANVWVMLGHPLYLN